MLQIISDNDAESGTSGTTNRRETYGSTIALKQSLDFYTTLGELAFDCM